MAGKVVLIVLDGVGIGAQPDADKFGDASANTLLHTLAANDGLHLPNLSALGLFSIEGMPRKTASEIIGNYGKCKSQTPGKDSTSGHWEIAGVVLDNPFPTYPGGFPPALIQSVEAAIGRETLFGGALSGTDILDIYGDAHVKTSKPIVYTSVDSVFQIAMHEAVIPLAEQYRICMQVRRLLSGDNPIARVIARPFAGESGAYARTRNRRDFSVAPPRDTILDELKREGFAVCGVGKIEDIFAGRGLTASDHSSDNAESVSALLSYMEQDFNGLLFANLIDFDQLYGHRNDAAGFGAALQSFDAQIPAIIDALADEDLLIITADHGCDPTTDGTDHTREYVPLLVFGHAMQSGVNLRVRQTLADIAATIADFFCLDQWKTGKSFLGQIL